MRSFKSAGRLRVVVEIDRPRLRVTPRQHAMSWRHQFLIMVSELICWLPGIANEELIKHRPPPDIYPRWQSDCLSMKIPVTRRIGKAMQARPDRARKSRLATRARRSKKQSVSSKSKAAARWRRKASGLGVPHPRNAHFKAAQPPIQHPADPGSHPRRAGDAPHPLAFRRLP